MRPERIVPALLLVAGAALAAEPARPAVALQQGPDGGWTITVDGKPRPIHGVGGATGPGLLEKFKEAGGNTVRTWGIDNLGKEVAPGVRWIDRAHQLGLMVVPGMWIGHERHGFNYGDHAQVQRQRDEVAKAVRTWKDHPAILMWGIGNEMEGVTAATGSEPVLREVEQLAQLVKREDPSRPTMTVIAWNPAKAPQIMQLCPSIDVLGLNSYGAAAGSGETLKRLGWKKPFAITEFGVPGPWEVGKTAWGAPIEPTSQAKARTFYATHRLVTELNDGRELCLGTFAFVFGAKQERTATWFGMLLDSGERLPQVDAMTKAWTGAWPKNRCPVLDALDSPAAGNAVPAGSVQTATAQVADPEGDPLRFTWTVTAESTDIKEGGDHEATPPSFAGLVRDGSGATCTFTAPAKPGPYRLFLTVRDDHGGAATANIPFLVR